MLKLLTMNLTLLAKRVIMIMSPEGAFSATALGTFVFLFLKKERQITLAVNWVQPYMRNK